MRSYTVEYHGRTLNLNDFSMGIAFGQTDQNFPRLVARVQDDNLLLTEEPIMPGRDPIHFLEAGLLQWGAFTFKEVVA